MAADFVADPVGDGSKSEEELALEQAASSGAPSELVSARTESTDTWAHPDGTWSVKRYGTPVRVLIEGVWTPTDPTLVFSADGTVVPRASVVDVVFSGGGSGPMLTGVKDGRSLSLTWSKALPKPTLEGNVATYAEVLPGVDLQLKAEVEGFSQLLMVKTAEAAAQPELDALRFELDTVGVDVKRDAETGSVTAVNPAGQTVFTSPSPSMWDSTTVSSETAPAARSAATLAEGDEDPAHVFDPPPGAQEAQVATTVSGGTLQLTPDQGLLVGEDTQYPVFIDPSWAWGEKQNWTRVYKAYPNTSFWNTKDPVRVGYEAETGGSDRVSRSFVQLDTSDTKGAQVKSSTFRIRNTWSWSCQDRPVQLWHTGAITSRTTWNNQPAKKSQLAVVDDSKGWSKDCAAGNLEFDVTAKMREAADKGWSSITFGLYAADETDTYGWKKFDAKTGVIETKYNHPPKTPTGLGTNPRTDCKTGGLIGNTRVSLYATFDDRDAGNLTAEFQIFKAGTTSPSSATTLPAAKGKVTTWVVPDSDLPTGDWTWKVRARDQDNAYSPWSPACTFTIDRTRPSNPPVISSTDGKFPPGEHGWPAVTGKAREQGNFSFAPNGVADVASYVWWTSTDPTLNEIAPSTPVSVTPPGYGPQFLYAYSVDKAGNRSDTATYVYYASRSQARDQSHDLNGDGNRDIWSIDSNGTLLTYAGQGGGKFSAATNGGGTFDDASIGSDGDWGYDGYNDLVTLQYNEIAKKNVLYVYPNAKGNGVVGDEFRELTVTCPVSDPEMACLGEDDSWTGDDHWHDAEQIVTPGDINGDRHPDLLVKQGKHLWAYYGNRVGYTLDTVRPPVLIGGGDWDKFTVVAPGDLNGDGIADLWLRDNTTGDVYRSYGEKDPKGHLDATTWGNTAGRVKIGTGYKASAYPAIGSAGDVTGDNLPDLWARKPDNTLVGWAGKTPGTDNTSFGTAFVIDGITGGSRIPAGTTLAPGQSYTSRSAKLTMQDDGNLAITSNAGKVLWSTKTSGNPGAKAVMGTDGNLAVHTADGATTLWESKTDAPEGYALLQDRGNLVVYNVKSQTQWSSGTAIRHDYNGDGRSDMGAWYDYSDGHDALQTLLSASDGTLQQPFPSYTSQVGSWYAERMQFSTGDYNGDGRGDMATLYGYSDGTVRLFTALGQTGGGFASPTASWTSKPGNWTARNMTLHSGDFNGDGRDDLAAWYDYDNGDDKLFTFTATPTGGFNAPFSSWSNTNNDWYRENIKFASGDWNSDGRDDLAGLYRYNDGTIRMFSWLGTVTGGFQGSIASWSSATFGDWNRTHVHAGDFNGDGRDDVLAWYDYADGHDATHVLTSLSTTGGHFATPKQTYTTASGNFTYASMRMVPGDYNGDGLDDLAALYGYSDGTVRAITWTSKADGTINGAAGGWRSATTTSWNIHYSTVLRSANP